MLLNANINLYAPASNPNTPMRAAAVAMTTVQQPNPSCTGLVQALRAGDGLRDPTGMQLPARLACIIAESFLVPASTPTVPTW